MPCANYTAFSLAALFPLTCALGKTECLAYYSFERFAAEGRKECTMAREKGYVMSPESKALCREGAALSWAPDSERRAFLDFKTSVGRAVRAGDAEEAHAIIDRFMAEMSQDEEDQD